MTLSVRHAVGPKKTQAFTCKPLAPLALQGVINRELSTMLKACMQGFTAQCQVKNLVSHGTKGKADWSERS